MTRLLLIALAAALAAGASGCAAGGGPAAPAARRLPPPGPGAGPGFAVPQPSQAPRDRAAAEACRRDADRVILYRDRGQLMREDERDARIGTDASIFARRIETDRLGRAFERDRLAAECLGQGSSAPSPQR